MWDLVIVGAGPAGASAALGALAEAPGLSVLLLDRADFPRDKACGDGIAPHVLDELAAVGVTGLLDDRQPVRRLDLSLGGSRVSRAMRRAAWVVPRRTFDHRLVDAAVSAGARLERRRVRIVEPDAGRVRVHGNTADPQSATLPDGPIAEARVVVGADGAHSPTRRAVGLPPVPRRAVALRGYAPTAPARAGRQVVVFGTDRQPSYAWSFDRGDGLANVGYGEMLRADRPAPTRALFLDRLHRLLPGAGDGGTSWRAHHLPLSSWRWRQPDGRVLLAGDASGLVNPLTGEGIYYAVATGIRAGRAAARAVTERDSGDAGRRYRTDVRSLLAGHLRHTALASRLAGPVALDVGLDVAAGNQRVFDDLVELGLGRGRITAELLLPLLGRLPGGLVHAVRRAG